MSKILLYCTKAKPYLYGMYSGFETRYGYHLTNDKNVFNAHNVLNGKIVAECDFEVEVIGCHKIDVGVGYDYIYETDLLDSRELQDNSCLDTWVLHNYLGEADYGERVGYAIHIKNLHIFDKQKELEQLETCDYKTIKKAPQNMMKCIVLKNDEHYDEYILISIKPEWLCKILNGEKTIEVRKKVLKEVL